jgi:hypothetical protein
VSEGQASNLVSFKPILFFKSRILIDIGVEISPLSARKVDFDI